MSGNFFRGTDRQQDSRFGNSDKRLMKRMKFGKSLNEKIDIKKVNIEVMSRWITEKITDILGFEDEVVIGMCINMLDGTEAMDPRQLQLNLTGFLEKQAMSFVEELWALLIDAQESPTGIPTLFLERKKVELLRQQAMDLSRSHRVQATNELLSKPTSEVAPLLAANIVPTGGASGMVSPVGATPTGASGAASFDISAQINMIRAEVSAQKAEQDRDKAVREEERADVTEAILQRREVKELIDDKEEEDRLVRERLKAFEEEDNADQDDKMDSENGSTKKYISQRSKDSRREKERNSDKSSRRKKDRHRHRSPASTDGEEGVRERKRRERKRKKKSRRNSSKSRSRSRDRKEKKRKGRSRSRSGDRHDKKRKGRSSSRERKSSRKNANSENHKEKNSFSTTKDAEHVDAVRDTTLEKDILHKEDGSRRKEQLKKIERDEAAGSEQPDASNSISEKDNSQRNDPDEEILRKAALETLKKKGVENDSLEEDTLRKAALASIKG